MIKLDIPFKIIRSEKKKISNTVLGVVNFSEEPFDFQGLKSEIAVVVGSLGESLKNAYGVKTVVEQPQKTLLTTKITPVAAELNKRDSDIILECCNIPIAKKIEEVCSKMYQQNKDNAILTGNNDIYFFHTLKNEFDPESTEYLLKATKGVLLDLSGHKHRTTGEVTTSYLRVDAELEMPHEFVV